MTQKENEDLFESLRDIVDWDSYEACFPSDIQPPKKELLTYLAKQLGSRISQGFKPETIGITKTLFGEPILWGQMNYIQDKYWVRGDLSWNPVSSMFEGSLEVEPVEDDAQELSRIINDFQTKKWHLEIWKDKPALVSRRDNGKISTEYVGQSFKSEEWDIIADYWDHAHCELCWAKISTKETAGDFYEGYTDGEVWICPDCFENKIKKGSL
ncbi:MAG: hypothetical protein IID32_00900 [Planctomycetes bacterium]|nr:hypothetical protein [Planctomycetota bacterium]